MNQWRGLKDSKIQRNSLPDRTIIAISTRCFRIKVTFINWERGRESMTEKKKILFENL